MTVPNTPLESYQAASGRHILAASKYIYRLRTRLGTRGLVILGVAVIAVGLALNWSWLIAIGVAPLLLTALPCVAMCALGVCMMSKHGKSRANESAADDAHQEKPELPPAKND